MDTLDENQNIDEKNELEMKTGENENIEDQN